MAKGSVQKRYNLAVPLSWGDANRLLGLPVTTPLTPQEFQDYAKRKLLGIKHKSKT